MLAAASLAECLVGECSTSLVMQLIVLAAGAGFDAFCSIGVVVGDGDIGTAGGTGFRAGVGVCYCLAVAVYSFVMQQSHAALCSCTRKHLGGCKIHSDHCVVSYGCCVEAAAASRCAPGMWLRCDLVRELQVGLARWL
jgi:hypothetical protein